MLHLSLVPVGARAWCHVKGVQTHPQVQAQIIHRALRVLKFGPITPPRRTSANLLVCPPLPVLGAPPPAASALCLSLLLGAVSVVFCVACYMGQSVPSCPQMGCVGTLGLPKGSSELAGGASSASTRGASTRARLQMELAQHRGTFFQSVMQSMSRRMSPTSNPNASAEELLQRGVSGVRYLERFGGYGRVRELGQLQFQVMMIFDFLMAENVQAAMDGVALLAVTLEQASLDGGRMELATLLCLQEDAPASIFVNRQLSSTSRAKSFAPLADQRWVTCALAFLKEMEVISAKRSEVNSGQRSFSDGLSDAASAQPSAKAKAKVAPKRKGKGKGNQPVSEETEA